jgi:nitrogen fixation/metabolism regulation signal transduction histidine kinase
VKYAVAASVLLVGVLLYLLSQAGGNTAFLSQHYTTLLVVTGALTAGLLILTGYQLLVLRRKLRSGVFGSKLALRLLLVFATMALVPGVLVYGVSVQFLTTSIESWFDVRVDKALEGGLNLGRSALEHLLRDTQQKTENMAYTLSDQPSATHVAQLEKLRAQAGVEEAALFSGRGNVIAFAGRSGSELVPDKPPVQAQKQARLQQTWASVDSMPGKGLMLRVVAPVNLPAIGEEVRLLQVLQPVPTDMAQDAEAVQTVHRDYQELSVSRQGLKSLSALTLTLTLLLSLLSAVALAFLLSEKLSAPLSLLAKGTRAVAEGDFSGMPETGARDELGLLMRSFNRMTRQLAEAREVAQSSRARLEAAHAYVESVLSHLSSGVLAFDGELRLKTANRAAEQILQASPGNLEGRLPAQWEEVDPRLAVLAERIASRFGQPGNGDWQEQLVFETPAGQRTLLMRGSALPQGLSEGCVVVFDDITAVIQAQRDAAWSEVARRLAHEIKNPLTPIQLSAERLEHKLAAKLPEQEADMLRRATKTIVDQVASLKNMVNAFSDYARAPKVELASLDLNGLLREVLTLYESYGDRLRLEVSPALPPVRADRSALRQVIHNLLQNAQDAVGGVEKPMVTVSTFREGGQVCLAVCDNGGGFPEDILRRAFEPYVTTKAKGTGLGLPVVKKIIEEHKGIVKLANRAEGGACVTVSLPEENAKEEANDGRLQKS